MICSAHQVEMTLAKRDHGWPVHRCPVCIAEDKARLIAVKQLWAKHSRRWPTIRQGRSIHIPAWER